MPRTLDQDQLHSHNTLHEQTTARKKCQFAMFISRTELIRIAEKEVIFNEFTN